ncbi:MAG TPA: hypothetical protein VEB59_07495 [Gemmatimonadales bacterium]|nr:hypothetical protein [Gemmatimonadales bacterium]
MIRVTPATSRRVLDALGFGPLQARNFDPVGADQGPTISAGALYVFKAPAALPGTRSKLWTIVSTAGSTLTAGQNWMGLYDPAGEQVGATADLTTAFASAQILGADLVTPYAGPPGDYWVGILANGGTPPVFLAGTLLTKSSSSVGNAGHTAADGYRFGFAGTGHETLPESFDPSAIDPNMGAPIWVGIS